MATKNEALIERGPEVGRGGFGVVYMGKYGKHTEVAIKDVNGNLSSDAITEANILKTLNHRNVIRYIDVVQTRNQTSLIMEFIDGNSFKDYIDRTAQSAAYWQATRKIMTDVAQGMWYLHAQRIVHADLKSLNVLLRHNYEAVICDFGLAKTIADSQSIRTNAVAGTELWFAPELCSNRPERSSFQSDIWAYGCIMLEVTSQKIPWKDNYASAKVLLHALANPENANIFQSICLAQRAPDKLRTILCQCCSWNKKQRPDFAAIVKDLGAITDTDLQAISEANKTASASSSSSNTTASALSNSSNKRRPSTGAKRPQSSGMSSLPLSVTNNSGETDTIGTEFSRLSVSKQTGVRKPSEKPKTDPPKDQPTSDDPIYKIVKGRSYYEGREGGIYYYNPKGRKTYVEKSKLDDSGKTSGEDRLNLDEFRQYFHASTQDELLWRLDGLMHN